MVDDVVGLLAEHGDDAKLLAGGQSLVPMMAMRLVRVGHVIDLNCVPALTGVTVTDGEAVVGATTRHAEIGSSEEVRRLVPALAEATPLIGHFQIRNRGTLGGSLAHADPAAEYPAVALALDARLDVAGPRGNREIGAS